MRNKSHVLVTLLSRECLYSGNWRSILSVRYYVLLLVTSPLLAEFFELHSVRCSVVMYSCKTILRSEATENLQLTYRSPLKLIVASLVTARRRQQVNSGGANCVRRREAPRKILLINIQKTKAKPLVCLMS